MYRREFPQVLIVVAFNLFIIKFKILVRPNFARHLAAGALNLFIYKKKSNINNFFP